MAAVAREMVSSPRPRGKRAQEASRKTIAAIGRAPRDVVCFACAHKHEIVLGRIDRDDKCPRCKKPLKQGVVIQMAAKRRTG